MKALDADVGEVQGDGVHQGKHRDNEFGECCRMATGAEVDLSQLVTSFPASWEGRSQVCDGWGNQLSQLGGVLCLDLSA